MTRSNAAYSRPDVRDDPTEFRVLNEIGIISQLSSAAFERTMPDGMSMAQFTVLNHFVRMGGPKHLVELARLFQVTKGAMTNTVGKLEQKGLVSVVGDPADGRAKLVDVTEAGRVMRKDCLCRLAPKLEALTDVAEEREWAAALPFLQKLRKWLDDHGR